MDDKLIVKNALESFKENELILASKLYKEQLHSEISEAAYYKILERMCKSGELVKIAIDVFLIKYNFIRKIMRFFRINYYLSNKFKYLSIVLPS